MCITTGISAVVVPQDTADIESRLCRATEMAEHEDVETAKNSTTNVSSPFGAGTFPNKELKSSGFADPFSTSPNLSAQQGTHPQGPLQQQQFNAQQQFNVQRLFNTQGPPQRMFNTQGPPQLQFNIQGSNAQGSPSSGAVLLIGSTGNGKSTLGNFLFDPRFMNNEYFEVATDHLQKTQTCKTVTQTVKYQERSDDTSDSTTSLTIIDTPGLNENKSGNDLEHMIDLVTILKEQKKFKACIFVFKSSASINQQYRDTI